MKALSLSPKDVADALGVSEASIKRWCDQGRIAVVRTPGGHRRLDVAEVVRFMRASGRHAARPELLGMPNRLSERPSVERARQVANAALLAGDEAALTALVLELFAAGEGIAAIGDGLFEPVFRDIGAGWEHGSVEVYEEHRAVEIAHRALRALLERIPAVGASAPLALTSTIEHDPYSLALLLVEGVLREGGWRVSPLGANQPTDTLCEAVRRMKPRLVCLSFGYWIDQDRAIESYERVSSTALAVGAAVAVGGRVLVPELRKRLNYSVFCDHLRHFDTFLSTLDTGLRRRRERAGSRPQATEV